jgi:tetratricopeptide (TPR) repeat protein
VFLALFRIFPGSIADYSQLLRRIGGTQQHLFEQAMLRPIEQLSSDATNLLKLFCFLESDSISIDMLRIGSASTDSWRVKLWASPVGAALEKLKEPLSGTISEMESVSVIQKLESEGEAKLVIRLHNIYQLLIRTTMIQMNEYIYWLEAAILLVVGALKKDHSFYKSWEKRATYRPHILSLLQHMMVAPDGVHQERFSQVLYDLGVYLRESGDYTEARDALTLAFTFANNDSILGPEHPDTLRVQVERAEVYQALGQYAIAEAEYREILTKQKKVIGKSHPDRINTIQKLSSLGIAAGQYEKSAETMKTIERTMKRATLLELSGSKEQRAMALMHLGQDVTAEQLLDEVRKVRENGLGRDHPQTLNCLRHLSLVYRTQERYKEAEDLCRHLLKHIEKTHGRVHLDTIHAKLQLSYVLTYSDRPAEAKDLLTPALNTLLLHLGVENPNTLLTQECLALALEKKSHFSEAAAIYTEVHQQYEAQHGANHSATLRALKDLARSKGHLGRVNEARGLFGLAMKGYKDLFGKGHPDTMDCLQAYGVLLMKDGDYVKAMGVLEEVLVWRRKVFRRGHPDIVVTERMLEECFRCVGKTGV